MQVDTKSTGNPIPTYLAVLLVGVRATGSVDGSAVVAEEDAVPLVSQAGIFFNQFLKSPEWYVCTGQGGSRGGVSGYYTVILIYSAAQCCNIN